MTKKTDPVEEAQKRQAEIVAEQEKAQSVQPTPTQEEADKAKLGKLDGDFVAPEPAGDPASTDDGDGGTPKKTRASAGEKPGSYKTRATSAG